MYATVVKLDTLTDSVRTSAEDHNLWLVLIYRIAVRCIVCGVVVSTVLCSTYVYAFPCLSNSELDSLISDVLLRNLKNGRPLRENAFFLNPEKAAQEFVHPVIEGLGKKAGPLVFEMAQVPRELISSAEKRIRLVERIGEFLNRLPKIGEEAENAFYAVEIRTPIIYTPRFVSMLRSAGARLVTGLHPTMPDVARQTNALHMMDCPEAESPEDFRLAGPLVVRWTLAMGDRFDDAKRRYEPFSKIQRPDPVTREGIATLILAAIRGGQPAYVVANNKAEGCAPLGMVALAERLSERLTEERDRDEQEKLLPTPPKAHP